MNRPHQTWSTGDTENAFSFFPYIALLILFPADRHYLWQLPFLVLLSIDQMTDHYIDHDEEAEMSAHYTHWRQGFILLQAYPAIMLMTVSKHPDHIHFSSYLPMTLT